MFYTTFAKYLDMGGWMGYIKLGLRLYQQRCQIRTWTAVIRAYVVPSTIRGDWCPDEHWTAQCKLLFDLGELFYCSLLLCTTLSMDWFRTLIEQNVFILFPVHNCSADSSLDLLFPAIFLRFSKIFVSRLCSFLHFL